MAKLKLSYPVFRQAPRVTCGAGSVRSVLDVPSLGRAVFMTSAAPAVRSALDATLGSAGTSPLSENWLVKPAGEPTVEGIEAGAAFLAARRPAAIVAVGGGSVLDWARLSWVHSTGCLDLGAGRVGDTSAHARPPVWLVPTTCGTGAEAGDVAVYETAAGDKRAVVSPLLMADRVVLDGKFLSGLGPGQLAMSLCDALSHGLEANLSLVPVQLGKEAGLACVSAILRVYGADGSSRGDRLMEAGFLGGVAAANCSVGIVHAFAHAMAADGLTHALGNACGLVPGLRFNATTPQMATLLERLGCATVGSLEDRLAPVLRAALSGPALPAPIQRLAEPGYRHAMASRMAADVALRSNPRRAEPADLDAFLVALRDVVSEFWTCTT